MKKTGGEIRLGMFHKFALVIIISGLAPMVILVTVLFRTMLEQYRQDVYKRQDDDRWKNRFRSPSGNCQSSFGDLGRDMGFHFCLSGCFQNEKQKEKPLIS